MRSKEDNIEKMELINEHVLKGVRKDKDTAIWLLEKNLFEKGLRSKYLRDAYVKLRRNRDELEFKESLNTSF